MKIGVKSIQAAAYNGAHTVGYLSLGRCYFSSQHKIKKELTMLIKKSQAVL